MTPQMNMCVPPPPLNGTGFVMPPPFFPADQYGMMMSGYSAPVLTAGGWAAPPPPPPPPPPSDSSGTHARGSGPSGLESDSRKRGLAATGAFGQPPPTGVSGGLGSGAGPHSEVGPGGRGGLGSGSGAGGGGGARGSGGPSGAEGSRSRGRERRRRGRGRDHDDFDSEGACSGGLGGAAGLALGSGGLDIPHGSLLPRLLPQTADAAALDTIVPQGANFTAFGSYSSNKRINQHGDLNNDSYENACVNAGFYGQQGGRSYGAAGGLGGPAGGLGGPAGGLGGPPGGLGGPMPPGSSAGYSEGRQRNRRR